MLRSLKYLKQYFRPSPAAVQVQPARYTRDGRNLPAMVYRPAARARAGSAWIVLHGLTYHGPRHPGLIRFASALAAAGHLVFIPEIEEWSRLLVAPALTPATIKAAADALSLRDDVDAERIGVFGFSFGATQALIAANDDELAQRIRTIVAWGGYADIARLVHFGLTGEHELDGVIERIEPDPYGRWIFGANYLTSVPGYEDMTRVADALMELAREAGRSGTFAGDPIHDPLKRRLASALDVRERRVFELFAPVEAHDMEAARVLAKSLAVTIVGKDRLMDPAPFLGNVRVPVMLAHGRDDRLVPYTESLLLRRRIAQDLVVDCTITTLFAHSGGTRLGLGPLGLARETSRFLRMLDRILTAV
jgi:pimeloyl-ACP methyl ester carboxylesterase